MAKKKILYIVTQGVLGGAQKYVLDLATGLKNGFDCAIAAGAGEGLNQAANAANIPFHRLTRLTREIQPFQDLSAIFEIAKLVKKLKPDIVHLNSSKAMVVGAFGAKLGGAKTVVSTMHGLVLTEPMPTFKKAIYHLAVKLAAPLTNAVIAVSSADKDAALKYRLKPADRVFIIHNGIDLNNLDFLPKGGAREKLLDLLPQSARNKKILLALSDHYPVKGLEILAHATSEMKNRDDFVVVNIGRVGPATKDLTKTVTKLNLQNRFLILNDVTEPARLLKAAYAFVLPSLKEGLPYAALFAAAAAVPIAGTFIGGTMEIVKNEKSGLLAEPGNPKSLARVLERLLDNPLLAEQLSLASKQESQRFDLIKMLQETRALYEKLGR